MLSLGLGLQRSKGATAKQDYFIDKATIEAGFFTKYSIEGGDLTFTADQTITDNGSGWLKIQYPATNQTGISGVNAFPINEAGVKAGRFFEIEFDVFLETADNWLQGDASNTTVTLEVLYGNTYHSVEVTPDTDTSISTGIKTVSTEGANRFSIFFRTGDDLPEASAAFYLKNLTIRQGRSQSIFP